MNKDKNLFRRVVKREEFFLTDTEYLQGEGYLNRGYYEKVYFHNETHIWYSKDDKNKLDLMRPSPILERLEKLYEDYIANPNYESTF